MMCALLYVSPWIASALLVALLMVPGVYLHEVGHWLAAKLFGCKASIGFAVTRHDADEKELSAAKRAVISGAGPLASCVAAYLLWLAGVDRLPMDELQLGSLLIQLTAGIGLIQLIWPSREADGAKVFRYAVAAMKGA